MLNISRNFGNLPGPIPTHYLDDNFKELAQTFVNTIAELRTVPKTGSGLVFTNGYYAQGDGANGIYYYNPSDTTSSDNGGTIIVANDGGRWYLLTTPNAKIFGAKGDGTTDDTVALTAFKNWAITHLPFKMIFPSGIYCYTDLGNLAYSNLTLLGQGDREVTLKCISSVNDHNAIYINAFASGSPSDPFIERMNLENIIVQGNSKTLKNIYAQGLARVAWKNVYVKEGKSSNGISYHFLGVQLSNFKNVMVSTDLDSMSNVPYQGWLIEAGTRAAVSVGNSSNNTFENCYGEGLVIGCQISGGDQNTFVSGAFESNSLYGLLIGINCRYNTFLGTGFENPSSTADVADAGITNVFVNVYSVKNFNLQGNLATVIGGFFERIQIDSGATKNVVENVNVNVQNLGSGGWFDSGTATEWKNLFDHTSGQYIYPRKDRSSVSVSASPFTYTNNTGQFVEVIIQSGTVSQVQQQRGSDTWLKPFTSPTCHLLCPNDALNITYSAAPAVSIVPQNGFQG